MHWPQHDFRAMGSAISLWLDAPASSARPAFRRVEALFAEVEAALSRFRPDSELMCLNRRQQEFVPVSPLLWEVAGRALALAQDTDGLFDPTVLPALVAAGYDRDFTALVRQARSGTHRGAEAARSYGTGLWRQVRRDAHRRALWLPAGAALDFGGIAKGYTAALAVAVLAEVGPCLVDAGGDITAGLPPRGLPGWPVAIAAPSPHDDEDLLQLWLASATLATSGIDYRRWQTNGRPAHHLIDPRQGEPATTDLLTVTVLAPEATSAEGWATAALIAGRSQGFTLLTQRQLAATLVAHDGTLLLTPAMAEQLPDGAPV